MNVRTLPLRVKLYACIAAADHNTTIARIIGHTRSTCDVEARRDVWRKLHDDGFSTVQIGHWTNKDHSTVVSGLRMRRASLGGC